MTDKRTIQNQALISRLESQIENDGLIVPAGSTNRAAVKIPLDQIPKGPNGRRLCRWCDTEIPKGRIAYCSNACQIEINVRCNPGSFRFHVEQRDKGVCAQCGFDTGRLERILRYAERSLHKYHPKSYAYPYDWKNVLLRRAGLNSYESLWSADHIIEVADGGGECGLENAQTLCQICHKAKTAENRRRRATERRIAVQSELKYVG